jgi:hypothetical protein
MRRLEMSSSKLKVTMSSRAEMGENSRRLCSFSPSVETADAICDLKHSAETKTTNIKTNNMH